MRQLTLIALLLIAENLSAQNIGIGTSNPIQPLEVAGTIFTSAGGIQFPDLTVQTTAATNTSAASVADPRLIGYLVLDTLDGPLDTLLTFPAGGGFMLKGFPVYEADIKMTRTPPPNNALVYGNLRIVTDVDTLAPVLFQRMLNGGPVLENVALFFTRDADPGFEAHYSIQLTNATIMSYENAILPSGGNRYGHLVILEINYEQILSKSHVDPSLEFCWDVILEDECVGGN